MKRQKIQKFHLFIFDKTAMLKLFVFVCETIFEVMYEYDVLSKNHFK